MVGIVVLRGDAALQTADQLFHLQRTRFGCGEFERYQAAQQGLPFPEPLTCSRGVAFEELQRATELSGTARVTINDRGLRGAHT